MSDRVSSQIDIQTSAKLSGDQPDIWAEFRQVERIEIELTQSYKHSLGKISRFFIELENRRFMATACETCGKVYAPPRALCPACLSITQWRELSGQGTLETYSVLHFGPDTNADVRALARPYVLAYVQMDGASTLFPHLLRIEPEQVRMGMRVQVAYSEDVVNHPIHLMYFVPLETT